MGHKSRSVLLGRELDFNFLYPDFDPVRVFFCADFLPNMKNISFPTYSQHENGESALS